MKAIRSAKVVIPAFIGAFYGWMIVNFWGGYAANSPINDWLLEILANRGYEDLYLVAIRVHDVIVNVLLAIPVAAILTAFRALNNWLSLLVAVGMGVVASYWDTKWGVRLFSSWGFWLGLGMSVWSLPIAFVGLRAVGRTIEGAA